MNKSIQLSIEQEQKEKQYQLERQHIEQERQAEIKRVAQKVCDNMLYDEKKTIYKKNNFTDKENKMLEEEIKPSITSYPTLKKQS